METEIWRIDYISCEGNYRWQLVEVRVGISEDDLRNELLNDYGYDDAPAEFISAQMWYEDRDMVSDWTHIETY